MGAVRIERRQRNPALAPLIVGITGASGALYGIRALELLRGLADVRTHCVLKA